MNRNDWLGVLCYMCIAFLFGADAAFICLIVKENADRVAYYEGEWNKGDIFRGCCAILIGWGIKGLLDGFV